MATKSNEYITGTTDVNRKIAPAWSDNNYIKLIALLYSNAKGTESGKYLDPSPLYNKFGKPYYTDNKKEEKARTDALNVGVDNMDYTNDDGSISEKYEEIIDKIDNAVASDSSSFVNLLMPQYARRVEVEDLDKNFWVIGTALDCIINAIWGKDHSIIETILTLIEEIKNIKNMIGNTDIIDISLQMGNSDIKNFFENVQMEDTKILLKSDSGQREIDVPFVNNISSKGENDIIYQANTVSSVASVCNYYNGLTMDAQSKEKQKDKITDIRIGDLFFSGDNVNTSNTFKFSFSADYFKSRPISYNRILADDGMAVDNGDGESVYDEHGQPTNSDLADLNSFYIYTDGKYYFTDEDEEEISHVNEYDYGNKINNIKITLYTFNFSTDEDAQDIFTKIKSELSQYYKAAYRYNCYFFAPHSFSFNRIYSYGTTYEDITSLDSEQWGVAANEVTIGDSTVGQSGGVLQKIYSQYVVFDHDAFSSEYQQFIANKAVLTEGQNTPEESLQVYCSVIAPDDKNDTSRYYELRSQYLSDYQLLIIEDNEYSKNKGLTNSKWSYLQKHCDDNSKADFNPIAPDYSEEQTKTLGTEYCIVYNYTRNDITQPKEFVSINYKSYTGGDPEEPIPEEVKTTADKSLYYQYRSANCWNACVDISDDLLQLFNNNDIGQASENQENPIYFKNQKTIFEYLYTKLTNDTGRFSIDRSIMEHFSPTYIPYTFSTSTYQTHVGGECRQNNMINATLDTADAIFLNQGTASVQHIFSNATSCPSTISNNSFLAITDSNGNITGYEPFDTMWSTINKKINGENTELVWGANLFPLSTCNRQYIDTYSYCTADSLGKSIFGVNEKGDDTGIYSKDYDNDSGNNIKPYYYRYKDATNYWNNTTGDGGYTEAKNLLYKMLVILNVGPALFAPGQQSAKENYYWPKITNNSFYDILWIPQNTLDFSMSAVYGQSKINRGSVLTQRLRGIRDTWIARGAGTAERPTDATDNFVNLTDKDQYTLTSSDDYRLPSEGIYFIGYGTDDNSYTLSSSEDTYSLTREEDTDRGIAAHEYKFPSNTIFFRSSDLHNYELVSFSLLPDSAAAQYLKIRNFKDSESSTSSEATVGSIQKKYGLSLQNNFAVKGYQGDLNTYNGSANIFYRLTNEQGIQIIPLDYYIPEIKQYKNKITDDKSYTPQVFVHTTSQDNYSYNPKTVQYIKYFDLDEDSTDAYLVKNEISLSSEVEECDGFAGGGFMRNNECVHSYSNLFFNSSTTTISNNNSTRITPDLQLATDSPKLMYTNVSSNALRTVFLNSTTLGSLINKYNTFVASTTTDNDFLVKGKNIANVLENLMASITYYFQNVICFGFYRGISSRTSKAINLTGMTLSGTTGGNAYRNPTHYAILGIQRTDISTATEILDTVSTSERVYPRIVDIVAAGATGIHCNTSSSVSATNTIYFEKAIENNWEKTTDAKVGTTEQNLNYNKQYVGYIVLLWSQNETSANSICQVRNLRLYGETTPGYIVF